VKSNSPFDTCSAVAGINDQCPAGGGNGNGGGSMFTCTGPGYFPDPSNCGAYHICGGAAPAVPTNLVCPPPLIYDVVTKTCRRPLFAGGCKVAECTVASAAIRPIQAFGKNQQFFVFCRVEMINGQNVAVPIIYKCADGARFNGMNCEYRCPGRGRFAHSDYPDRYFECNWVNLALVGTEQICPVDTIFQRNRRICVRNPAIGPVNPNGNDDDLNAVPAIGAIPAVGRSEPLNSTEGTDSQEATGASFQIDTSESPLREVRIRPSRKQ
jgi:Chitin binding Peritrophin-A domain